jgi:hypothetical protein
MDLEKGSLTEVVALGRRLGGKHFDDLQPDDILWLINSHKEELSTENLMQQKTVDTLLEDYERISLYWWTCSQFTPVEGTEDV